MCDSKSWSSGEQGVKLSLTQCVYFLRFLRLWDWCNRSRWLRFHFWMALLGRKGRCQCGCGDFSWLRIFLGALRSLFLAHDWLFCLKAFYQHVLRIMGVELIIQAHLLWSLTFASLI